MSYLWEAACFAVLACYFAQITSVLLALVCQSIKWGYYLPPRVTVLIKQDYLYKAFGRVPGI